MATPHKALCWNVKKRKKAGARTACTPRCSVQGVTQGVRT